MVIKLSPRGCWIDGMLCRAKKDVKTQNQKVGKGGEEEEICAACHRYSAGDVVNVEGRSALEMRASQLDGARGGRMSRCLHRHYKDLTHHCPDSRRPTTTNTPSTRRCISRTLSEVVQAAIIL